MADALVSIGADLSALRREMAKIGPEGGKASAKILNDLTSAIGKSERAAKDASKKYAAMARAQRKAAAEARKHAESLASLKGGMMAVGAAVAGMAYGFVRFEQGVADSVNDLTDMQERTGIAAETLAGLQLAAEGSGQQLSNLDSALGAFPKRLADFSRGSGDAKYALEDLGFASDDADGMLGDMDGTIRDVLGRLQAVEEPGKRAAMATQIFGRAGGKLMQALSGSDLDTFVEQARSFGIDVGPQAAQSAADWQRAVSELSVATSGAAQAIAEAWSGPAGPAEVVRGVTAGVIFASTAVSGAIDRMMTEVNDVASLMQAVVTRDWATVQRVYTEISSGERGTWVDAWEDATSAAQSYLDTVGAIGSDTGGGGAAAGGSGGESPVTEQARAEEAAQRAAAKASADLVSIREQATLDVLSGEARLTEEYRRQQQAIVELAQVSGDTAAAQQAAIAAQVVYEQDLFDERMRQSDELAAREKANDDAVREHEAQNLVLRERSQSAYHAAIWSMGRSIVDGVRQSAEEMAEIDVAEAERRFAAYKSLAIAEATISGFAAAARALKDYMYPWSLGIAALAMGSAGAQVVQIAGTEPAFDVGGLVGTRASDQVSARMLPGEGVVSRQGMAALGEQGLHEINRGQVGQQSVIALPVYRHWERFARDATRRGELGRALTQRDASPMRGW